MSKQNKTASLSQYLIQQTKEVRQMNEIQKRALIEMDDWFRTSDRTEIDSKLTNLIPEYRKPKKYKNDMRKYKLKEYYVKRKQELSIILSKFTPLLINKGIDVRFTDHNTIEMRKKGSMHIIAEISTTSQFENLVQSKTNNNNNPLHKLCTHNDEEVSAEQLTPIEHFIYGTSDNINFTIA